MSIDGNSDGSNGSSGGSGSCGVVAWQRGGVAIVASEDFNNLQLQHGHSQCVLYRGVPLQSQCAHAGA